MRPWSCMRTNSTLPSSIKSSEPHPQTPCHARRSSTVDTAKSGLLLSRFLNPLLACIHGTFAFCLFCHFLVCLGIYAPDEAVSLAFRRRYERRQSLGGQGVPYRPSAFPCVPHHPRPAPSSLSWVPSMAWLCRLISNK